MRGETMSMYELIFADGEKGMPLMGALGFKSTGDVGRYRSAWLEMDDDGKPRIAVYTRNGGNNREHYMPDLEDHPNFLFDRDDSFDNTYATIYFSIPEDFEKYLDEQIPDWKEKVQAEVSMSDQWMKVINSIKAEEKPEDAKEKIYNFSIVIGGTGKTAEEAWNDACSGFAAEPGPMEPSSIELVEDVE